MIIFKIKYIYLLYIYVTACLIADFKQPLCSYLFKYIESQYFSYLARDLLSEVICDTHVEKFGDPCSSQQNSKKKTLRLTKINQMV
jgi:hypothetical protein